MSTTISSHGHSCIRLEKDGRVLVLDPGGFSDAAALEGAGAVLVTHEHVDHVVPDRLTLALAAAPGLQAWAPAVVVDQLVAAGAPADRLHAVAEGDTFTAEGFSVQVVGRRHAVIHPSIPVVANVAYLVDDAVLHPGDSFTRPPAGVHVEVLLLPVSAPWMKLSEATDYLQAVAPVIAVPIHDAILSDAGRGLVDRVIAQVTGDVPQYRRLAAGETLTA
jgi:L-ascorbate metabolism protein UlaG (beta-lactamase superfamily)